MFEVFIAACVLGIIATLGLGVAFARTRVKVSTDTMFGVDITITKRGRKVQKAILLDAELGYVVTMYNGIELGDSKPQRMVGHGATLESDGTWSASKVIEFGDRHGLLDMIQISHNDRTMADMRESERELKAASKVVKMNAFLDHVLKV